MKQKVTLFFMGFAALLFAVPAFAQGPAGRKLNHQLGRHHLRFCHGHCFGSLRVCTVQGDGRGL